MEDKLEDFNLLGVREVLCEFGDCIHDGIEEALLVCPNALGGLVDAQSEDLRAEIIGEFK